MATLFSNSSSITNTPGLGPVVSGNAADPAKFPATANLSLVATDGGLGQLQQGSFSNLGPGNIWSSLGLSPYPPGNTEKRPYGLRLQRNSDFALFQLIERVPGGDTNDVDTVIGWGDDNDDRLRFQFLPSGKDGTDVMTILSSGNVGIGTLDPKAKLQVLGDSYTLAGFENSPNAADGTVRISLSPGVFPQGDWLLAASGKDNVDQVKPGEFYLARRSVVPTGGLFGKLQTITTPVLRALPNGDVIVTKKLTQSSSRSLKRNIASISSSEALDVLKGLNPVKFVFRDDQCNRQCLGFIAEDVPDLVATPNRDAISPMDIIAVLTKALQAQESLVSELSTKLASLESRMAHGV